LILIFSNQVDKNFAALAANAQRLEISINSSVKD